MGNFKKIFFVSILTFLVFCNKSYSEVVKKVEVKGNERIAIETRDLYKQVWMGNDKSADEIEDIKMDKRRLPKGKNYKPDGYESRQVVNIVISSNIIEYRAQVLVDDDGIKYVAEFPKGVTRPIQYGASVKANATYSSVYQLIPYERIEEQFRDEHNIPVSKGSIYNFNSEASNLLVTLGFEQYIKHLKGGGSGSPRKNDNDYCQIMYPAYEGKVVMDQLESIETDQDKETWKSYIRTKKASFYATGIETEENNMKLAYNIIRETILYCKDKEGIETKLLKGEYKYDLFIELLTSIFELSSIISLGDGGETEAQKTLNNIINSGNATEFADFWNSLELGVKESALSSSSFFNNWVSYFNRNIFS